MNDTIELIKNHRSIRRFTAQQLPAGLLDELIGAGQAASTSSYGQMVSLVRVREASTRAAFVELSGGQKYIQGAAEFLVFCADLQRSNTRIAELAQSTADFAWTEQFLAASVDVALFAQNVVIAAESAGLGCCYIGGIRNDPERVTSLLELPELVYPVFGLCLGYPDQAPAQKPRLPLETVLHPEVYIPVSSLAEQIDHYDEHVRAYYVERTGGKLNHSWTEQMAQQARTQSRPFMKKYLQKQGFMKK